MSSRLIRLNDDTLVEVEVPDRQAVPLSGGAADKVSSALDIIQPILTKACKPVVAAWQALKNEVDIEKTEIEFGLSFEGEGNIYISKAKAGANLTIKITLKPSA